MEFSEVITTPEALCAAIPERPGRAMVKDIDHIDEVCRRFIAASPFVLIATRGADGLLDVSPKGDPAGFVAVLDETTLAIPDRPGNTRLDGFRNLLNDPALGLIFLIPGHRDTLRVRGTGRIVRDEALRARFEVNGKMPAVVLVVDVAQAFLHCPKCMARSKLWDPAQWPDLSDVPSLAEGIAAHTAGKTVPRPADPAAAARESERLY